MVPCRCKPPKLHSKFSYEKSFSQRANPVFTCADRVLSCLSLGPLQEESYQLKDFQQ